MESNKSKSKLYHDTYNKQYYIANKEKLRENYLKLKIRKLEGSKVIKKATEPTTRCNLCSCVVKTIGWNVHQKSQKHIKHMNNVKHIKNVDEDDVEFVFDFTNFDKLF